MTDAHACRPANLRLYCVTEGDFGIVRIEVTQENTVADMGELINHARKTLRMDPYEATACWKFDPPIFVKDNPYLERIRTIAQSIRNTSPKSPLPATAMKSTLRFGNYFPSQPEYRHIHILVQGHKLSHMQAWTNKIWSLLWGEPEAITSDDSTLHPCFDMPHSVHIQEEYKHIWKYIEGQLDQDYRDRLGGLVLWGHPGIGKTSFLYYALAKALAAERPVAVCFRHHSSFLFTRTGVATLSHTMDASFLPNGVLALCDTNQEVLMPPMIFGWKTSPAFTVHAASHGSQWRSWRTQKDALVWTMSAWRREEILNASTQTKTQPNCYSPIELFDLIGPSPRACLKPRRIQKTGSPETDIARYFKLDSRPLVRNHFDLALALGGSNILSILQMEEFHGFFLASPRKPLAPDGSGLCHGPDINYMIPTAFLQKLFLDPIRTWKPRELFEFLKKLRSSPKVAALVYTALAVQALSSLPDLEPLTCTLACGTSFAFSHRLDVVSLPESFAKPFAPADNTLYIPPVGFATIDAVAVTENARRLTLLQMTLAEKHVINLDSIRKILDCFTSETTFDSRAFVFVVPSETKGEMLSARRSIEFTRVKGGSASGAESVDVGWAPIPIRCSSHDLMFLDGMDGDELTLEHDDDPMAVKRVLMRDSPGSLPCLR
ncbi:hypothetical protein BOTBODRAFT_190954 [Botryobasidium botryosum FD-172 SS1]|uniref:Crinkler effector protein N-terminal domain-containing protein n=1 Tax=Botryobasidium botryosum (strain FD-172 SS1) TaxID=930990 RepID=A0A067MCL8_BOTB1|nr:hypothetical protein BOTBODRAFT_190954 [Botryobasidium botryosum FD-172 SS1]